MASVERISGGNLPTRQLPCTRVSVVALASTTTHLTNDHLGKVADQLYDLKDTLVMNHEMNYSQSKEKVHFRDEGAVVAPEIVEGWW